MNKIQQVQIDLPEELMAELKVGQDPEMMKKNLNKEFHFKAPIKMDGVLDALRSGYEGMADINLNMAEMGLCSDIGCLESYESQLESEEILGRSTRRGKWARAALARRLAARGDSASVRLRS